MSSTGQPAARLSQKQLSASGGCQQTDKTHAWHSTHDDVNVNQVSFPGAPACLLPQMSDPWTWVEVSLLHVTLTGILSPSGLMSPHLEDIGMARWAEQVVSTPPLPSRDIPSHPCGQSSTKFNIGPAPWGLVGQRASFQMNGMSNQGPHARRSVFTSLRTVNLAHAQMFTLKSWPVFTGVPYLS